MPAACQHSICQQCCMRIVEGPRRGFKCAICRRDNSAWLKREFSFVNEPLANSEEPEELEELEEPEFLLGDLEGDLEEFEGFEDFLAGLALRNQLINSLNARYPNSGRNWDRDLPRDMALLEVLQEDLSIALGLR